MRFERKMVIAIVTAATLCQPVLAAGLSVTLVAKGCEQLNRGNYGTAISLLTAAVRQNPADLEARRHLSSGFIGAGMAKEALQQLQAIVRVAPGNARDYVMMAEAHYQMGDTKKAIVQYKQAMLYDPASSAARIGLARALMSTGDLRGATNICQNTLRSLQDPQSRKQFVELLSTIKMHGSIVRTPANS